MTDRGKHREVVVAGAATLLSERELTVLGAVASGLSDAEISCMLGLTVSSTRYAIRVALTKLGAVNRAHAVARAVALQLLTCRV